MCAAIGTFEEEERPAADSLLVHPVFYFSKVSPRSDFLVIKAPMFVLGATQHNSWIDHVLVLRLLVVDGFTTGRLQNFEIVVRCTVDQQQFGKFHGDIQGSTRAEGEA